MSNDDDVFWSQAHALVDGDFLLDHHDDDDDHPPFNLTCVNCARRPLSIAIKRLECCCCSFTPAAAAAADFLLLEV